MNLGIKNSYDDGIFVYAGENEWEFKLGDALIFSDTNHKEALGSIAFLDRKKLRACFLW